MNHKDAHRDAYLDQKINLLKLKIKTFYKDLVESKGNKNLEQLKQISKNLAMSLQQLDNILTVKGEHTAKIFGKGEISDNVVLKKDLYTLSEYYSNNADKMRGMKTEEDTRPPFRP